MATSAEQAYGSMSTGLDSLKFETLGARHEGTITRVSDLVTLPKLGTTTGETQDFVVFDLRCPDGSEGSIWTKVPSKMARTIADAVRAAAPTRSAPIPQIGDYLIVVHHATEASTTPGFNPAKLYQAALTPGAAPAAAAAMTGQLTPSAGGQSPMATAPATAPAFPPPVAPAQPATAGGFLGQPL